MRVVIFGTHVKQTNGYSKVVYELMKATHAAYGDWIELHLFGFQNFRNLNTHRCDLPPQIQVHDAFANEKPQGQGFGVAQVREYVERIRPDVCVVFNDILIINAIMKELKAASNRNEFKVLAYLDQVYLCQRPDLVDSVNNLADGAIAFTDAWKECIQWQGLKLPCHVLPHGINRQTYFPVPKALARKFFGMSPGDFLVLNLNRNQPRKRWDICLQAFAEVVKRLPNEPIKLVIGTELKGAWSLIDLYQRELRKRNVPLELGMSRLVVPGKAQSLSDEETNILYNAADVGINTCDGEGFGLCNFEQAAVGIPQIVPRIGGFVHYLDDTTSIMVQPRLNIYVDSTRDGVGGEAQLSLPDDYADAIVRYWRSEQLRRRHGAAARKLIVSRFEWDKIATMFRDILVATVPTPRAATPRPAASDLRCVKLTKEAIGAILSRGSRSSSNSQLHEEIRALQARLDALLAQAGKEGHLT